VTSAALILFLAFSPLASGPEVTIKIFATGLAAGILLDATAVRALLVPSLTMLFGRWNRWPPKVSVRVLRVEPSLPGGAEPATDEAPPTAPASGAPPRASGALRRRLRRCRHKQPGALAGRHSSQRSRCESGAVPQL